MNQVENTLLSTNTGDLLRAYYSNKEYVLFNISVFNAGVSISIKCTNIYKEINPNTWNGYDFICENGRDLKEQIKSALENILNDFMINKTDNEIKRINKLLR